MQEAGESATQALRASFAGSAPPDITRKITACVACRKQKIKCHIRDKPPCSRCKKRGLSCTVNKSLQTILDSDVTWKEVMQQKLQTLESVMEKMAQRLDMTEELRRTQSLPTDNNTIDPPSIKTWTSSNANTIKQPLSHWEVVMDPESGPAAIPGSCVSEVSPVVPTPTGPTVGTTYQDVVSRGLISLDKAQAFCDIYQNRLDHFLYRILIDCTTLDQIRSASPLLTAAVCTVGALHLNSPDFDRLYQEFVTLSAAQMFSKTNTIHDVRALCIGAFWLSGLTWTLVGAAVRIATEMQLHRSIFKALQGDRAHYLRTRLYLLVYVCDHQSSIAYGRPPLTHDDETIRASLDFIKTENAVEDDARLVSQVQAWSIAGSVFKSFGVDVETPFPDTLIPQLTRHAISFDGLAANWSETFIPHPHIGNYPKKGVAMHYHFGKLYLYSHAFRGIGRDHPRAHNIALKVEQLRDSAVLAASATLRLVIFDAEMQSFLNGLPTYFHIMIAFAVVFLLKVSTKYVSSVKVDTKEVQKLVSELSLVLNGVTESMHPSHLLVSIAKGIETLLSNLNRDGRQQDTLQQPHRQDEVMQFESLFHSDKWLEETIGDFAWSDYDFLASQDWMNDLETGF